tara:strand:+ start:302 stop:2599 length:2298 start_codon:yes stop_codon:yes gene_type:complete
MAEEEISLQETEDLGVTDKENPEVVIEGEEPVVEEAPEDDFAKNLAEDMDERDLEDLASQLISDFKNDKETRSDWEDSYTKGLDLLGFKYTVQTRPFQGASGVTHPLLAEAVTQFQAQAYKELLPADGPVRTQVIGKVDLEKEEQATRVKDFMNYMITEQMEEYTPEFDQLLFYLPLAGSTFKKIYYDEVLERAVSKFVPAEDLVLPYYTTSLVDCERITHVIRMTDNEVRKNQVAGFYRDIDLTQAENTQSDIKSKYNSLEGVSKSSEADDTRTILEMHVDLDLEDDNNVKIPYIVTIDDTTQEILSIYRNYKEQDRKMKKINYFVHYKFLPGLGFYGFGLIHMIGGLSTAATSALRQLLDAGTLSNLPAGFKARGMRIRDDDQPIQPGEFRDVDAPGGNIREQFQLLPFKEPSATLFQLMGFCVDAGKRFAGIADMQMGEDSANRAVGTTIALLERGARVMSAIHKRLYYGMKQEFKILARVFSEYLPPEYPYDVFGGERTIKQKDFDDRIDILPVADPNIFSMSQRVTLAQTQLQIAQTNPGIHNIYEAYRRVYTALGTKQIDELLIKPENPTPKDPAIENMEGLQMRLPKAFPEQDHEAHIEAHKTFMQSRMVQINPQVYALFQGHISEHISMLSTIEIMGVMRQDPQMAQLEQQDPEQFQAMAASQIAKRVNALTTQLLQQEGGQQQDPLVALKQRELDLKAMDIQMKAKKDEMKMDQQQEQFEDKMDLDSEKLQQDKQLAEARLKAQLLRDQSKKQNVR